jgi:hypothetical protein
MGAGWCVSFQRSETKNKQALDVPLPIELSPYIDFYLSYVRRSFSQADQHQAVWASAKGGALRGGAIYDLICARTKAGFGRATNPHMFRDARQRQSRSAHPKMHRLPRIYWGTRVLDIPRSTISVRVEWKQQDCLLRLSVNEGVDPRGVRPLTVSNCLLTWAGLGWMITQGLRIRSRSQMRILARLKVIARRCRFPPGHERNSTR